MHRVPRYRADLMTPIDLLSALDACVDNTAHPAAKQALTTIRKDAAYLEPELHWQIYDKLYRDFILPHVAAHDTEPWTSPIHDLWQQNVPRQKAMSTQP